MELSKRILSLQESATLVIADKARALKAKGVDVISFSAGEPDFDTPDVIKDAAIKSIKDGFTKYTPSSGIPELRKLISEKFKKDNGLDYDPSDIVVSCGAKHSIYNVIQAACNDGDEVLIPCPCWVSYTEMVKAAGAVPVLIPTSCKDNFRLHEKELLNKVSKKTKMIIINSPNNPTGAVMDKDELAMIARVALDKRFFVLSDEIYEKLIYDGAKHISIGTLDKKLKEIVIVVNGVSKAFSMTGWRIGYAAGPKELMKAVGTLQSHTTSNPTSISQKAAAAGLEFASADVARMAKEFGKRRDYIVGKLNSLHGIKCNNPKGAFYAFPDVSGLFGKKCKGRQVKDSDTLGEMLIDEAHIAVVPGSAFLAGDFIRFSYATSMENIVKGMDRFEAFVKSLS